MNFFEVLFWMGMLCLFPVVIVVIRDRQSATQILHGMSSATSSSREQVTMPAA